MKNCTNLSGIREVDISLLSHSGLSSQGQTGAESRYRQLWTNGNACPRRGMMCTLRQKTGFIVVFAIFACLAWENQSYQLLASSHIDQQPKLNLWKIGVLTFEAQWCLRCHNLDLKGGIRAPSLDNVGVRRSSERLRQKLLTPQEELAVSQMPSYGHLSQREIDGLVAFLSSLTPQRDSPDNRGEAKIEIPSDNGNPRFTMPHIERGKALFFRLECIGCHTIKGIAPGGSIGPNLTHESRRKRSDEWQLQHLNDPVSVYTGGLVPEEVTWVMPSFGKIPHADLEALVAFLQSLN
jgi:mono/diheme cytochrome c family protein